MPTETAYVPPTEGAEIAPEGGETSDLPAADAPNPGREKDDVRSAMLEEVAAIRKKFAAEESGGDTKAGPPAGGAVDASPPAAGSSKAPAQAAPPPAADSVQAAVDKALADREARNELREAAKREADEIRARALKEAQEESERFKQEFRRKLLADPAGAIKEAGWEPVGLMQNLAEDGTPTAILQRQLRVQGEQMRALQERLDSQDKARAEAETQAKQARERAELEDVGRKFRDFVATDARPTLKRLLAKDTIARALIQEAASESYRRSQERGGKSVPWDELADWLEASYRDEAPPAAPSPAKPPTPGKSAGARPISQAMASEKRATAKAWEEMTPQEQKRDLTEYVKGLRARIESGEVQAAADDD